MKKILILGSSGAGKSTLAKKLKKILDIDIIHLDQYYWKPNWIRSETEEWRNKVKELIKKDRWIMDGNYQSTLDIRLPEADTIIFLNFSAPVCFFRALKRRFKHDRQDKLEECKERITFEFAKWVLWDFPRKDRKDIINQLEILRGEKDVIILKSSKEVELFLVGVKNGKQKIENL